MSLDAAARRRYARQLLLGEIDEDAQERLLDARFRRGEGADVKAFAVAADYLERAGCTAGDDGVPVDAPNTAAVLAFAQRESLRAAAATVIGAFTAVEHAKQALGIAQAKPFPADLRLVSGE